jgi:hypothetical protein
MALIGKDMALKILVLGVVALFMFETFAYYGGAKNQAQTPAQGGTGQTDTTQPSVPVAGAAIVQATVLSYSSELALGSETLATQAVVKQMEDEGLVQYKARRPDGILVLNFGRSANLSAIATRFDGTNTTLAAKARLRTPSLINFTTATGPVMAVFQDVSVEISPDVPVGQNITLRINANILDSAVQSYVAVPVALKTKFTVAAKVLGYKPDHLAVFEISWDKRVFDQDPLRIEFFRRYPQGSFTLLRNSSVLVDMSATANFSEAYVIHASPQQLDINESFTDSRRIEDDLLSAGQVNPVIFPATRVVLEINGSEADFSFVKDFMNYDKFNDYRSAHLELPATVEVNGTSYVVKQRAIDAPISAVPVGNEINVTFDGSTFAGTMINIQPDIGQ